ncbi:MAG: fold metallo-hydrolase [Candidatus Doudnabacteria bacterium]|nr:fold metallo-hydrolase [Candidatus Doudnabacteria bacterium]
MLFKTFGKNPAGKPFKNIEPTEMMLEDTSYLRMLIEFANKSKLIKPSRVLPAEKTNLIDLPAEKPTIVWFGHSSYLIKYQGFTIMVDPVLFGPASPVSFIGKPFATSYVYQPDEIPNIDLLILTHDHYDHLSYKTIGLLKNKISKIITPSGVGSHLRYWGFNKKIITELSWQESTIIEPRFNLTAVPARHFSGRFLTRNKTLWSAYVLQLDRFKIFIGGDSGYDQQFKNVGSKYGPFDLALLECGQYGKNWPYIHMFPEQTAQAAADLQTKVLIPVHWAKFILSIHAWNEPPKRLIAAAEKFNYKIITPKIGAAFMLESDPTIDKWWDFE